MKPKLTAKDRKTNRFWSHVNHSGPLPPNRPDLGNCWVWVGAKTLHGYGSFKTWNGSGYDSHRAHRFSYELAFGPISKGMHCCHHCDNPSCVNPAHLFIGTRSDNMRDAMSKGRFVFGDRHPLAKLTPNAVLDIRGRCVLRDAKYGAFRFAEKYGVSEAAVRSALKRRSWIHV